MKKQTGSFQAAARFIDSSTEPICARAVAEVVHREVGAARLTLLAVALRPCVAGGHRGTAADDRVRAERTGLEPLQVHRAAAAAAVALGEAEDLGEGALQHRLDGRGDELRRIDRSAADVRERLGEELVVPAVRAVHGIRRPHPDDGADRAALLPDAGVRWPVHEALGRELEHGLLERTDEVQLAEHRAQQLRIGSLPVGRRRRELDPVDPCFEPSPSWHWAIVRDD